MRRFRSALWMAAAGLLISASATLHAQPAAPAASPGAGPAYPNRPVRITTAEAGGGNDLAARLIAPALTAALGQPVVVENRGGAGGAIAAEYVARAAPDGYTLLLYASNVWLIPFLQSNVRYDPVKDFAPISLLSTSPLILVIHPSLPANTVKDLIALARARPGALNYGSGGTGSQTHLSAELFKAMTKVNIVRVSYKGNGPALADVLSGQLQLMFVTTGTVAPHRKSGRLRALAVTSARPSALAPDLPTVAASGVAGYEAISIYGTFAPAKTAEAIITRLNQEIVRVLNTPDIKEKFINAGVEVVGSSPEQFTAVIKADMARMGKVIKDAGIRDE
jgi:tripartite-type tricarboxylate transporter receptor subunit TctC